MGEEEKQRKQEERRRRRIRRREEKERRGVTGRRARRWWCVFLFILVVLFSKWWCALESRRWWCFFEQNWWYQRVGSLNKPFIYNLSKKKPKNSIRSSPMPFSRSRVYFPNKEMQSHHAEQEDTIHHSMFTKLHQSHTHHFHHQHQHQHQHQQNHGYISEEDDCRSSGGNNNNNNNGFNTKPQEPTTTNSGGATDGATIEIIRRPRGRPPGSKNKPKPPLLITRDAPECAMRPIFLQLPNGLDIMDSIARFTRKRSIGLTILNATGSVTNVSIRQPNTSSTSPLPPTVTFHGRFDILSISATFFPPSPPPISSTLTNSFTISLAGPQGQIIGGSVVGSLIAAGSVYIMAASFSNPSYHRLPVEEDDDLSQNDSVGVDSTSHHPPPPAELSMYSAHCVPSDFIWTPATTTTARQPPPY